MLCEIRVCADLAFDEQMLMAVALYKYNSNH